MACGIVSNTKFKTGEIAAGADEGFLDATSLAEYLVKKGVPFRTAHGIVGKLVALCEQESKTLAQLDLAQLKTHCDAIEDDIYDCLGARNVVRAYCVKGAGSPTEAKEQVAYWKKQMAEQ